MPSVCAGTASGPCRFGQAHSGGPVHVQRQGGRCLFCDLERLEECVQNGSGRAVIRRALQARGLGNLTGYRTCRALHSVWPILSQVFLKNDEDIFEEALARLGDVTPDLADLEESARRLVSAGDWFWRFENACA